MIPAFTSRMLLLLLLWRLNPDSNTWLPSALLSVCNTRRRKMFQWSTGFLMPGTTQHASCPSALICVHLPSASSQSVTWHRQDEQCCLGFQPSSHHLLSSTGHCIVTTLLESAVRCEFPARVFLRGKLDNNAAWIPSLVTLLLSVRCCASMRCGFKAVNTIGWKLLDWCCDLHLREILMFFTYTTALMAWMRQKSERILSAYNDFI